MMKSTVRVALTEPFDLDPRYAVLKFYENISKTYSEELNKSFFKTMLRPVYEMFGARFIAENLTDKPDPNASDLENWSNYFKELKAFETSITNMMEAKETCELFK